MSHYDSMMLRETLESWVENDLPLPIRALFHKKMIELCIDDCGAVSLRAHPDIESETLDLIADLFFEAQEKKRHLPKYFVLERAQ